MNKYGVERMTQTQGNERSHHKMAKANTLRNVYSHHHSTSESVSNSEDSSMDGQISPLKPSNVQVRQEIQVQDFRNQRTSDMLTNYSKQSKINMKEVKFSDNFLPDNSANRFKEFVPLKFREESFKTHKQIVLQQNADLCPISCLKSFKNIHKKTKSTVTSNIASMTSLSKKSPKNDPLEKNMKLTLGIVPVKENNLLAPISVKKKPLSRNPQVTAKHLTCPSNEILKNVSVKDEELKLDFIQSAQQLHIPAMTVQLLNFTNQSTPTQRFINQAKSAHEVTSFSRKESLKSDDIIRTEINKLKSPRKSNITAVQLRKSMNKSQIQPTCNYKPHGILTPRIMTKQVKTITNQRVNNQTDLVNIDDHFGNIAQKLVKRHKSRDETFDERSMTWVPNCLVGNLHAQKQLVGNLQLQKMALFGDRRHSIFQRTMYRNNGDLPKIHIQRYHRK